MGLLEALKLPPPSTLGSRQPVTQSDSKTGAPAPPKLPEGLAAPPATLSAAPAAQGVPKRFIQPGTVPRSPIERKAPNPGWGGSRGDDSSVTFDARAVLFDQFNAIRDQCAVSPMGTLELDAGHSGRLLFLLTIEGFQDNLAIPIVGGNDSFTQEVKGLWQVSADNKGSLKIVGGVSMEGASSNDTDYSVQPISVNLEEAKGVITLGVLVVGKTQTKSTTTSGGVGGKVKGVEVSGGVERGNSNQTGPGNVQETFTLQIKVVNIPKEPPPPDPKGTVKIGNVTAIRDEKFVVGPFVVKSATKMDGRSAFNPGADKHLKATSVQKAVYDLYTSLPQGTRDSIANGKLAGDEADVGMKIEIHGYASNTDTDTRNYDLSLRRAKAVLDAFKSLGVPASAFQEAQPHGEWDTRDDKGMEPTEDKKREKESADWRKVVIKMRYTVTIESGE